MPNINPNSTNYVHSFEPNTNDLVHAMAYDPYGAPVLRIDDTTKQHTAKNRVKVSTQELWYFNTYQYGKDPDVWDESTANGGSATFDPYLGNVVMAVGSTSGSQVIRQTRRVIRYTPGRQNEISFAIRFETPVAGIRRRLGLFNELNGVFFEDDGGNYSVVIRRNTASGVVETRVAREDWSEDKLDGTGPSGITADPTKQQLIVIEYDWYGAGQVEFKWIINNNAYPIHKFNHANVIGTTWANTPFLPVRLELTNTTGVAGTHYMYQGSLSVQTEGSVGPLGVENNASNLITGKTTGNTANVFVPMLSIRLKTSALQGIVIPIDFQAATLDNTAIFFRLVLNPVLTGASWVSKGADSFVEYDITATAQTNGTVLKTGFLSTTVQGQIIKFDDRVVSQLGRNSLGTVSDILSIEIASVQANKDAFASINWIEVR